MDTHDIVKSIKIPVRTAIDDILIEISWGHVSTRYMGKSRSWLSRKLNGKDSNGGDKVVTFTDSERDQLRDGLRDLARRINDCADKI